MGVASVLAACQKEPEATEEVQISSNGLDPDGCAHDNSPPVPVVWVFVSEKHRGHHNNTAKLCMQTSPIDVLKSTASCYDNGVSSFRGTELLSLNVSVKTLWGHKADFETKDVGGVIIDSVGRHFSAHLLNIGLYICWRMALDGIAFSGGASYVFFLDPITQKLDAHDQDHMDDSD